MNINLFGKDIEEADIGTGYIKRESIPSMFPVTRTISAKAYPYDGKYYFKTRELAALFDLKQPSDFTQKLRRAFGEESVLSGDDTKDFRDDANDNRITFISAETLKAYLESRMSDQIPDKDLRDRALKAVGEYLRREDNDVRRFS